MSSAWIRTHRTPTGKVRYHVRFRRGGRESKIEHAGAFKHEDEAEIRRKLVLRELARGRNPRIKFGYESEPTLSSVAREEILGLVEFVQAALFEIEEKLRREEKA